MTAVEFSEQAYKLLSDVDWLVSQSDDLGSLALAEDDLSFIGQEFIACASRAQERIGQVLA